MLGPASRDLNKGINPGQHGTADQQLRSCPVPREPEPGQAPRKLHNRGRRAPAELHQDARAQAANALSSSEDKKADARQRTRQNNRQRKQQLTELHRENHELYNLGEQF